MPATHRLAVRVYYEDTDLAGIVYYANYLKFMERGRTEMLRGFGIEQSRLKAGTGLVFVVTRVEIDYRSPARFDDLLTVETVVTGCGAATLAMHQRVCRDATPLAEAAVRLACIDGAGTPRRLPAALREAMTGT